MRTTWCAAAARDGLTPQQRRPGPAGRARTPRPPSASSRCTNARARIGGLSDWDEVRGIEHGVEVVGYWGQAVSSADEARGLIARTGARGLAGDLFVDGALGSRTAGCTGPTTTPRTVAATRISTAEAIAAHLRACTEAGVTAGFHVIGDAAVAAVVDAFERVVEEFGAPAVARCGHRLEHLEMVTAKQATALGAWGVLASMQPNFDALWGGDDGMYCPTARR